jgi:hypothetical protein
MKKQQSSTRSLFGIGEILEILDAYKVDPQKELVMTSHLLTKGKINSLSSDAEDIKCLASLGKIITLGTYRFGCLLKSGNTSYTLYATVAGQNLKCDIHNLLAENLTRRQAWIMVKELGSVLEAHSEITISDILTFLTLYDRDILFGSLRKEDTAYAVMETLSKAKRGKLRRHNYIGGANRASMGLGLGKIEITDKGESLIKGMLEVYEKHNKKRRN